MNPRNPTTRFSDRAGNYDLYRPDYPNAIMPWLEETIGLNDDFSIADIGSGLVANKRKSGVFETIDGTAENNTLKNESIDLLTVTQASFRIPFLPGRF